MPVAAAITLNTVVYAPRGTSNGVTKWAKPADTGFGGGTSELTESVKGPDSEGKTRVRSILTSNKLATVDTACACAGSSMGLFQVNTTIDIPGNATAAERQDFRKRYQSYVASAEFIAAIDNLEGVWG